MSRNLCCVVLASLASAGTLTVVQAHPDDPKQWNIAPRHEGPGYRRALDGDVPPEAAAGGSFDSDGMILEALVTVPEFGAHTWANDCWGYTSPSGREYAIIGLSDGTGFVEITDPGNPVIIGVVAGPNSTWRDIKVYQDHAYAVSEGGDGIQVIPITDIDNGNLGAVTTVTTAGTTATHNVALNEDSGYLYRCGGQSDLGIRIYDLSNPAVPVWVSTWTDKYVHDAQIVSYTNGPLAGREIAFLCAGFNNGGTDTGLTILDVTDKQNMFETAPHLLYPNNEYSHQGWLSLDRQYFFLGDELDEQNAGLSSTLQIIDVSDVTGPFVAGDFTNGSPAITHNLYTNGNTIYAANYSSGIRVFDATSPLSPTEIAYFDTRPENDGVNFEGLWSNYPYFASGTIIGSDRQRGLFVWTLGQIPLAFSYPNGLPALLPPLGAQIVVQVNELTADPMDPATATVHHDTGSGLVSTPMTHFGGGLFTADFPALDCGNFASYYFSVETVGGTTVDDPLTAPGTTYEAFVANGLIDDFVDNFELDLGWTVTTGGGLTSGAWERGVPVDDPGWPYDPASDADGSGQCYLTENAIGNTDVDNGFTQLTSPLLDLSAGNLGITYDYFLKLTVADGFDFLRLEVSDDGGTNWTIVNDHTADGGLDWHHEMVSPDVLTGLGLSLNSNMRVRFGTIDDGQQSIVEAGIDGFKLQEIDCNAILGDLDGNGLVGISDLFIMFGEWGPCPLPCPPSCQADLDGDCQVAITDLFILFGNWD